MSTAVKVVKAIVYVAAFGALAAFSFALVQPLQEDSKEIKELHGYHSRRSPEAIEKQKSFGDALKAAYHSKDAVYLPKPKEK